MRPLYQFFTICHQDDRSRADRDKEELDHAIALSLAEDLKRPNGNYLFIILIFSISVLLSTQHFTMSFDVDLGLDSTD